jgi:hypothetical protein
MPPLLVSDTIVIGAEKPTKSSALKMVHYSASEESPASTYARQRSARAWLSPPQLLLFCRLAIAQRLIEQPADRQP